MHTTFSALTEEQFRTYATDLLEAYPGSTERQRLQAYMLQTIAQDRVAQDAERAALIVKGQRRRLHQAVLEDLSVKHAFDFQRSSSLFTEQTKTDQQILDLLKVDDAEVYIRDRNISGTIELSGDNVKFAGLGSTGTAIGGDLAHTCIVTGRIIISGSDVTLEGIHFKFAAEWEDDADEYPMVGFTGSTNQKLTFKNCTFENTGSDADGRFFHGENSGGGTQVIEGCLIKAFTSWMLLDATTGSATPTVKLDAFTMDSCKIENCMGSMAVRGIQANPNGTGTFTNNVIAFGANGQHASFWDVMEFNNTMHVTCTGNTCTGATLNANRGFLQTWSRSAIPWVVHYKSNTIENFGAAVRIACNATFYCPNTYDSDSSLAATAAETSSITNGASFVYPYNDATQVYAPENAATFSEPSGDFVGLVNFAHA